MFDWFKPRCPAATIEKVWAEKRMAWLAQVLGFSRMQTAEVILPTPEFFPDTYRGTEEDAQALLDRVCGYMGAEPGRVELEFIGPQEGDAGEAVCTYAVDPGEKLLVKRSDLADPSALVATLARGVGRSLLLGDRLISATAADHEQVAELLTVFLGLGLFGANSAVQEASRRMGRARSWALGSRSTLSEQQWSYALALFAWGRGEDSPAWAGLLRANVRGWFKQGLDYLRKTGDSGFGPGPAPPKRAPRDHQRLDELIKDLQSPFAGVRLAAVWDLRLLGEPASRAVPHLIPLVADPDEPVRVDAVRLLGDLGPAAEAAVTPLVDAATMPGPRAVRETAALALGRIGRQTAVSVPALAALLGDGDSWLPCHAARALRALGPAAEPALPALVATMTGTEELVAEEAVHAIAAVGPGAAAAVPALLDALETGEGLLTPSLLRALGKIGTATEEVLGAVTARLHHSSLDVRRAAALALGRLGPPATRAVQDLLDAQASRDPELRRNAAWALARIDGRIDLALATFKELLPPCVPDETSTPGAPAWDEETCLFVVTAVRDLGARAIPALVDWLRGEAGRDRAFAAWMLGEIGPAAVAAVPALRERFADSQPPVRLLSACADWLIAARAEVTVPGLVVLLDTALPYQRLCAELGLQAIGGPAVPTLLEELRHGDDARRAKIADILGGIAGKSDAARRQLEEASAAAPLPVWGWVRKALARADAVAEEEPRERLRQLSYPPFAPEPGDAPSPRPGAVPEPVVRFLARLLAELRPLAEAESGPPVRPPD
jgi:HEAT repeat protein